MKKNRTKSSLPPNGDRTIEVNVVRSPKAPRLTRRVADVCLQFGLTPYVEPIHIAEGMQFHLKPGTITLLIGPSGSGKSAILQALEDRLPRVHSIYRASMPTNRAIVDCIARSGNLTQAMQLLTACALGEPKLWLRRFNELSEGEQFRAKLAYCIGLAGRLTTEAQRTRRTNGIETTNVERSTFNVQRRMGKDPLQRLGEQTAQETAGRRQHQSPERERRATIRGSDPALDFGELSRAALGALIPILCDEFCSTLHRRAAKAIAYNLRKLVRPLGLTLVLACSNDDLVADLQPDTLVTMDAGVTRITERQPRQKPLSFRRRLVIEPGGKRDYLDFKSMHYRRTDELGFVDKVFVLRERSSDEKLAIVVYSHPPLELRLRNQVLNGRFKRNPRRLNREVRILRRLVVHPDVRGCGLGHYLVRKTLPLVGTPYVECLASMGDVNPVFEKAGMKRIGECPVSRKRLTAVQELMALEVDILHPDFIRHVVRRPRVRRIVARSVTEWYQATTGAGEKRVKKQTPELLAHTFRSQVLLRPVYYLWKRREE